MAARKPLTTSDMSQNKKKSSCSSVFHANLADHLYTYFVHANIFQEFVRFKKMSSFLPFEWVSEKNQ